MAESFFQVVINCAVNCELVRHLVSTTSRRSSLRSEIGGHTSETDTIKQIDESLARSLRALGSLEKEWEHKTLVLWWSFLSLYSLIAFMCHISIGTALAGSTSINLIVDRCFATASDKRGPFALTSASTPLKYWYQYDCSAFGETYAILHLSNTCSRPSFWRIPIC